LILLACGLCVRELSLWKERLFEHIRRDPSPATDATEKTSKEREILVAVVVLAGNVEFRQM
jgi:hypothetical protein